MKHLENPSVDVKGIYRVDTTSPDEQDSAWWTEQFQKEADAFDPDEGGVDLERREARQTQRFDSISEEIRALNAGEISEPSTVLEADTRLVCSHCNRKFMPGRLEKHMAVCSKVKQGQEWRGTFSGRSNSDRFSSKN